MSLITLINSTDITQWANRRPSQDQFPKLIRRMIRATVNNINSISIRADEGIQLPGFDGILDVDWGNEFVPDGKSVWEFGTNSRIKDKADQDYEKRKENLPEDLTPTETTYIFVTPRRWSKKEEWIKARRKESFWKDVRAFDADDLETWLEAAPAVHIWLSILLGKHPETAVDIDSFWTEWTELTNPVTTSELIISGRIQEVEKIHKWLNSAPSALSLRAESKKEAIAFFAAALQMLPSEQKEALSAHCVIIENFSTWRQLSASEENLILIANFEDNQTAVRSVNEGHHIMIPLGNADSRQQATINITRLNRANAKQALVSMGFSDKHAENLATLARRSFMALRRKIAISASAQTPSWAQPAEARNLLPILLVGGFNDTYEKDRAAITDIARVDYEVINDSLTRWANEPDPPVRRIGNTWLVASKEDSWSLLAHYLTRQDLEAFESFALNVLGKIDPQFELPADTRWQATILAENIPYSGLMREGIAETLAVMAMRSNSTSWADAISGEERVNRIVFRLLNRANENWKLWSSISYLLPLLAEAAPNVFLDAVESGLKGDRPVLLEMFSEPEDSWLSDSSHTGLLWALERLAWNEDCLGHSALLLAKLARLDPGGKLLNRPDRSLQEIFLCWHPHTTASLEKRLRVLDAIRKREPEVSWNLLNALLPERKGFSSPTSSPQWRDWKSDLEQGITIIEFQKATDQIIQWVLEDVGVDAKRWSTIINQIANLPAESQNQIIETLLHIETEEFSDEKILEIWSALREVISHHREFPTADWSMPTELTDKLETLYHRFTPKSIVDQYAWLFSYTRSLNPAPYIKEDVSISRLDENHQVIEKLRLEAVNSLFSTGGLSLLIEIALKAKEPGILGGTLGSTELLAKSENKFLEDYLTPNENSVWLFSRGFVIGRFSSKGWKWAAKKLSVAEVEKWSPAHLANFLTCLPFNSQTWDIVDRLGQETKKLYWEKADGMPTVEDAERATEELVQYHRPQVTVSFLSYFSKKEISVVPAGLIIKVLTELLVVSNEVSLDWNSLDYGINNIFESLDHNAEEILETEIAKLELAYMSVLERYGRGTKLLHAELERNPEFFVELASIVYRAEDEINNDATNFDKTRFDLARKLIESWHVCPGRNYQDATFDAEKFRNWIRQARVLFQEKKRVPIGDILIGKLLAFAPHGIDEAFPHEEVREFIEEVGSHDLERGIEIQTFNNRGVTTRALDEGGDQERLIAERYSNYAKKVEDRHPRTAAMLRRVANNYLSDARRQDLKAELEQDLWR